MPKLKCVCGGIVNLSAIPNEQGFSLFWEPEMETVVENICNARDTRTRNEFKRKVYNHLLLTRPSPVHIYECPHCGRLAVFARASDDDVAIWYTPEVIDQAKPTSLRRLFSSEKGQLP
jgi:hypothetical protein